MVDKKLIGYRRLFSRDVILLFLVVVIVTSDLEGRRENYRSTAHATQWAFSVF